jgi:hypothetical protein
MSLRFRRYAAALSAAVLLIAAASPIAAASRMVDDGDRPNSVPVVFDAIVLRPIGLMMTVFGAMFYAVPVAPIVAMTRPTDLGKPLSILVVGPARFTFGDPLGQHP